MNSSNRWGGAALSAAVSAIVGCAISGCGSTPTAAPIPSAPQAVTETARVQLQTIDKAGYDAAIAKLRGNVVLVDFWATWCEPCVEQLPHTLALGEKFRDRGLAVVTVSCDEVKDANQVASFLTSKNAGGATNLISQFGGSPKSMEELEISTGAVPFYKLYDRSGRLRQTFGIEPTASKQFTTADIEAGVEKLLTE